jgi:phosphoribosylformylglycinamidine cyclo-ligase
VTDKAHGFLRETEAALRGGEAPDAYARAGVDISAGAAAVERYRAATADWQHPSQLGGIGGFSGLFALPGDDKRALVASTDGVGTKVLIAAHLRRYDTVGTDLVNHCVNDILVTNAVPLFFLDYLAVGKLDPEVAGTIVGGIQAACRAHEMALLGGETAEMPGVYGSEHFDLAGTIVGIVDRADVPDPETVVPGDAIVALPALGLHTNGYSLVRTLIPEVEWAEHLLAPHPSYYSAVRAIQRVARVRAMAHITGGGLLENVARTLPESCKAVFEESRWAQAIPEIMRELVRRGNLSYDERYRILNMGIGYTLIVPMRDAANAESAWPGARVVGWTETRRAEDPPVVIHPSREPR